MSEQPLPLPPIDGHRVIIDLHGADLAPEDAPHIGRIYVREGSIVVDYVPDLARFEHAPGLARFEFRAHNETLVAVAPIDAPVQGIVNDSGDQWDIFLVLGDKTIAAIGKAKTTNGI